LEGAIAIVVNLDVMLAKRKMKLNDLSIAVGVSVPNLSVLKTGKAKAVRFSTLEAICRVLDCQPGDILEFRKDLNTATDITLSTDDVADA
jgi:putative transcriptional regulator